MGPSWTDGQMISASMTIPAGETVAIDPGATITMSSGVTITVNGTLTASSMATHAKLTGSGWTGIVVASGGTVNLNGVDMSGASVALDVHGTAEYDNGTINSAAAFNVESGGALTTKKSTFAGNSSACNVAGSFTASYLTYTAAGSSLFDGIVTTDPAAQLSIEDSMFTGPGPNGPLHDMLVSTNGGSAKFHVAYSSITGVHCGFHFDTLSEFDISYVNNDSNAYGAMFYGSGGAGPFTVSYSNFDDNGTNGTHAYDAEFANGPIVFDHDHLNGQASDPAGAVSTTNPSSATVTGTGPR